MKCRCCLWWPSLAPLPRASLVEPVGKVGDRLSSASLHICTACDSALSLVFPSALSLVFFTSGSFSSVLVIPWVTLTTFSLPFCPDFSSSVFGGSSFSKVFLLCPVHLNFPIQSENILHSPHAGYFLPILLLLYLLLSFVRDFLDCSCFALRIYSS